MLASLTGAVCNPDDDNNKSLYLVLALSQGTIVLVASAQAEYNELRHNDVVDIEAQARVNGLTQELVYGKRDYSPQLWAMVQNHLENGYSLDMVLPLIHQDRQQALTILSQLENTYSDK
jgi:hypothetical protein